MKSLGAWKKPIGTDTRHILETSVMKIEKLGQEIWGESQVKPFMPSELFYVTFLDTSISN